MCGWECALIPWLKFYLEVRPGCLLYLFVTIFPYFSYRPLEVLEAVQSLGVMVDPAFMKAFFESGQKIHLARMEVEDLEPAMGFLEEMCTRDEIKWCVLQQYLKDLQERRNFRYSKYAILDDQHFDHVSDWASRLGFRGIAYSIKAIGSQYATDLSESENVSNECKNM
jgi:hypothetical protein